MILPAPTVQSWPSGFGKCYRKSSEDRGNAGARTRPMVVGRFRSIRGGDVMRGQRDSQELSVKRAEPLLAFPAEARPCGLIPVLDWPASAAFGYRGWAAGQINGCIHD